MCHYLRYEGISTRSFPKCYTAEIYNVNGFNIALAGNPIHSKIRRCCFVSIGVFLFVRFNVALQSEIGNLRRLQLKLQFVSDKGDELTVRGFSLGIADGIAEKSLQSIQVASVPGYFDGVSDGTLHAAGGGLECFCHLGVQYLGDGVGVPYGPPGELPGVSDL